MCIKLLWAEVQNKFLSEKNPSKLPRQLSIVLHNAISQYFKQLFCHQNYPNLISSWSSRVFDKGGFGSNVAHWFSTQSFANDQKLDSTTAPGLHQQPSSAEYKTTVSFISRESAPAVEAALLSTQQLTPCWALRSRNAERCPGRPIVSVPLVWQRIRQSLFLSANFSARVTSTINICYTVDHNFFFTQIVHQISFTVKCKFNIRYSYFI